MAGERSSGAAATFDVGLLATNKPREMLSLGVVGGLGSRCGLGLGSPGRVNAGSGLGTGDGRGTSNGGGMGDGGGTGEGRGIGEGDEWENGGEWENGVEQEKEWK